MKIYAIAAAYFNEPDILIRFYKTMRDAKWGMNKLLAGEDEEYEWDDYDSYEIVELEVEE